MLSKMTCINFQNLLEAFEWVSAGETTGVDSAAYVSRATGSIHWSGEGIDEELPEDIEDESQYVAVPSKRELELGRSLALSFVAENLPDAYERIRSYFGKKGAYAHFKAELDHAGQLEAWYEYEQRVIQETLLEWSKEHGFLPG